MDIFEREKKLWKGQGRLRYERANAMVFSASTLLFRFPPSPQQQIYSACLLSCTKNDDFIPLQIQIQIQIHKTSDHRNLRKRERERRWFTTGILSQRRGQGEIRSNRASRSRRSRSRSSGAGAGAGDVAYPSPYFSLSETDTEHLVKLIFQPSVESDTNPGLPHPPGRLCVTL